MGWLSGSAEEFAHLLCLLPASPGTAEVVLSRNEVEHV